MTAPSGSIISGRIEVGGPPCCAPGLLSSMIVRDGRGMGSVRFSKWRSAWMGLTMGLFALIVVACSATSTRAASLEDFQTWLSAETGRTEAFTRFQSMLDEAGVSDVVPDYQLWLTDQINPQCVEEDFTQPPEALWPNIIPALRYIRDEVKPAVGNVQVMSGFRTEDFNTCIGGARRSAHRAFQALDLVPTDAHVTRQSLIDVLCPLHARTGPARAIGLGIYSGRRFHIDARGYRGWGGDHRSASFPCAA